MVLSMLLVLNLGVGWLLKSGATPPPEPAFVPDFEATLQLVQVPEPLAQAPETVALAEPINPVEPVERIDAVAQVSAVPQRCAVWGPYTNAEQAQARAKAFGQEVQQVQFSSQLIEKRPHYLVYIGPYANKTEATKVHDKLIADGVDAYVLTRGHLKNAVSVGLYAGPSSAQKQRARVDALGYETLQTKRKRMRRVHHLSAWVADNGQRYDDETDVTAAAACAPATSIAAVSHGQ